MEQVKPILNFLLFSENLKKELRHSWLSDGRRESVAEHSWQMALMAILMYSYLEHPIAIEKTLKMILIHDLVEAEVGDIPFFENTDRKTAKQALEQKAIEGIRNQLPPPIGQEIYDLWYEFEEKETIEAKFAKALDHLEVQIQHNFASLDTWIPIEYDLVYTKMDDSCSHDAFLVEFCEAVKQIAENKMLAGGVDVVAVKQRCLEKLQTIKNDII